MEIQRTPYDDLRQKLDSLSDRDLNRLNHLRATIDFECFGFVRLKSGRDHTPSTTAIGPITNP